MPTLPTITGSAARTGSYGIRFANGAPTGNQRLRFLPTGLTSDSDTRATVWFRFSALPATGTQRSVFHIESNDGKSLRFTQTDTGAFMLDRNGATSRYGPSAVATVNTWHRLDIRFVATGGIYEGRLNGVSFATGSGVNLTGGGVANFYVGLTDNPQVLVGNIDYDDAAIRIGSYVA